MVLSNEKIYSAKALIILFASFLFITSISACKNKPDDKDEIVAIDEEVPEISKKAESKHDKINSQMKLDENFVKCLPKDFKVLEMNTNKNQVAGDFDADGIFEISFLVQKEDIVKLIIFERDTLGNCTQKFETGNLTTKLISDFFGWRLANTMTTRFGGPKGTSENLFFAFQSDEFNLKLTFYGDQKDGNYYLLHSEYILHKNKKHKNGQIIVQDFLKQEKKVMPRIGSRKNMTVDKLPKKMYPLESLNYETIMALVK